MKQNWLLALSPIVGAASPVPLPCQRNSTKQSGDSEPVYDIGQGVTPPRATYPPMPESGDASRQARTEGVVALALIVGRDGRTRDIEVGKSLSPQLDGQAMKAVS